MKKTKITIWLEEGKPTRVKTTKNEEFFVDDLSQFFQKASQCKEAKHVARQTKNCSGCKRQ